MAVNALESRLTLQPGSNLPPAAGIRAHIELSRIMDEIVNKVYRTDGAVHVMSETLPRVHAAMQRLSSWVAELPPSLQLHKDPNPERACLMLHMLYNQVENFFLWSLIEYYV